MGLPGSWRKLVLLVHVITSVGLLGAVAGFLALSILGATSADAITVRSAYVAMAALTWFIVMPLAGVSVLIGIAQSLVTPWGLFRHYWVITKLVLTVVACVVLALQTETISSLSVAALNGTLPSLDAPRMSMVLHATGGLVVLLVATGLSVYKPRGITQYGFRMIEGGRNTSLGTRAGGHASNRL